MEQAASAMESVPRRNPRRATVLVSSSMLVPFLDADYLPVSAAAADGVDVFISLRM
ncbi:protein of unknown function (plasmid) [Shinella sp. WSC3-e]|nr:protein of unknown function [Shinella sp. WSC3-e]